MKCWSVAPLSLRAYVILSVASSVVGAAISGNPVAPIGVALTVVIAYFLLKRVRWLWFLAIVFQILGMIDPLTLDWSPLHQVVYVAIALIGLALLLAPETRRYFARKDAVPAEEG
jgi:hypothetical protein